MEALKLKGKKILKLGYPEGRVIGVIIDTVMKNYTVENREEVLKYLKDLIRNPAKYYEDKILRPIVITLTGKEEPAKAAGMRAPEIPLELCGSPSE